MSSKFLLFLQNIIYLFKMALKLDRFQKEAISFALSGYSVLVSAPTGAGKTLIAELVIKDAITHGDKVIYTAPIKAISNQKYKDFLLKFGGEVGIITGDISISPEKPVLIMTTEIFRNKAVAFPESLSEYKWVIFDEFHYIDDHSRGTVWEESLIFLPDWMRFIGLSATVTNINEIADWINHIHGRVVKVVVENKRPVPLKIIFYNNGLFTPDLFSALGISKKQEHSFDDYEYIDDIVSYIQENKMFPCIYFTFSRSKCAEIAEYVSSMNIISDSEGHELEENFKSIMRNLGLENDPYCAEMIPLIRKGVAFHHAGLVPIVKEAIEELFSTGRLKFISTTETFALGINMPAKTCIFDNIVKFSDGHKRYLKAREFHQMAGRAGRRGMDKVGYIILRIPNRNININILNQIIYSAPEPIKSKFNPSYSTILNIYKNFKGEFKNIISKSLFNYQSPHNFKTQILENVLKKISLLKKLNYIRDNNLSPKGYFASKIFSGELILAEMFSDNSLENINEFEFIALLSSIVLEKQKTIAKKPKELSQIAKNAKKKVMKTYEYLKTIEQELGIKSQLKKPNFSFSDAVVLWAKGEKLSIIADKFKIFEGDLIWNIRRIIQILRQINNMKNISEKLRNKSEKAIKLIKKDIVDYERFILKGKSV